MRFSSLITGLILITGLGGTVYALRGREGNGQFVAQQQVLAPPEAAALERLIVTTSDPRPGYSGKANSARCTSVGHGALGNPWRCVVRYPRLPPVRYRVTVYGDRSIYGIGQSGARAGSGGVLTVRGCCVTVAP